MNASNGTLGWVTESNSVESLTGAITSGAFTGTPIALGYVTTLNTGTSTARHRVTAQQFVNTQALTVSENFG
jgi:hypothetical protein